MRYCILKITYLSVFRNQNLRITYNRHWNREFIHYPKVPTYLIPGFEHFPSSPVVKLHYLWIISVVSKSRNVGLRSFLSILYVSVCEAHWYYIITRSANPPLSTGNCSFYNLNLLLGFILTRQRTLRDDLAELLTNSSKGLQ